MDQLQELSGSGAVAPLDGKMDLRDFAHEFKDSRPWDDRQSI
jgi:hypothetical protein